MKWLHISDIHFNYTGYDSENLKDKFLKKLDELKLNVDFILVTGDCLYQYNATVEQQNQIISFIKSIAKKSNCANKRIYLCQGNHDVNRNDSKRNELIESIRESNLDFSEHYEDLCESSNEKFQIIHRGITGSEYDSYKVFEPKNTAYRIISIGPSLK